MANYIFYLQLYAKTELSDNEPFNLIIKRKSRAKSHGLCVSEQT